MDSSSPHEKRRRVPRRPIERKIGLLVAGQYALSKVYEIGEGGALIESPFPLKQGQRAVISFRIPGVLNGVVLSRVVYVLQPKEAGEGLRYGMQFEQIEFDLKRKIRNFVASNSGAYVVRAINEARDFEDPSSLRGLRSKGPRPVSKGS